MVQNFGSRVDKYQQRFCNTQFAVIQLTPAEFAVICLLLLRGPQTPGELKAHSGRLHEFAEVAEVDAALESLLTRSDGPFVARLPREPRRKDHAYAHLFCGPVESVPQDAELPTREPPGAVSRRRARHARCGASTSSSARSPRSRRRSESSEPRKRINPRQRIKIPRRESARSRAARTS